MFQPAARAMRGRAGTAMAGSRRGRAAAAEPPPRLVDGVEVVGEEFQHTGLSTPDAPVVFKSWRWLLLADGSRVAACTDCEETRPTWGEIRRHRIEEHGDRPSGPRGGRGVANPPAGNGLSVDALQMTLGELLPLAGAVDRFEAVVEQLTLERDEAVERATAAERRYRQLARKLQRLGSSLQEEEGV